LLWVLEQSISQQFVSGGGSSPFSLFVRVSVKFVRVSVKSECVFNEKRHTTRPEQDKLNLSRRENLWQTRLFVVFLQFINLAHFANHCSNVQMRAIGYSAYPVSTVLYLLGVD
jgi:hypothetical protein